MESAVARVGIEPLGESAESDPPLESRLALGGLLAFALLLPVQVPIRVSALGNATVAVWPADLALGGALLAFAVGVLRGAIHPRLDSFAIAVCAYVACMVPSIATSESLGRSAIRTATALTCAAAALLVANLVGSEATLRKVAHAWLAGTALTVVIGLGTVILFYLGAAPALVTNLTSDFGSLPAGPYPRVSALFARQPNTLCHYLSVSLFVACGSASAGWLSRRVAVILCVGILLVAAFTVSPGVGAVLLGLGWWLFWNPARRVPIPLRRVALASGLAAAVLFVILIVIAPAAGDEGVRLPIFSFRAAPSSRVVCWEAAWAQFAAQPLVGRGVGVQPTCPAYVVASGATARLADAHNMYLSVASTQGLLGLVGLGGLMWTVLRRSFPLPRSATPAALMAGSLAIAFVQSWLYQGLAGSFEYMRHGWLLMGLLWATLRIEGSRSSEASERMPRVTAATAL